MTVFNPTSFHKGFAFVNGDFKLLRKTQSDIDKAVEALELEEAKNAICCLYNSDEVKRYNQFFRLIDKIVELNANGLTPEHKARNYTLEAASQLAHHMQRMSEAYRMDDKGITVNKDFM